MRIIFVAALLCLASTGAEAQTWSPPADSQRCPSKWGAGDQRGAANHMKAETVSARRGSFGRAGVRAGTTPRSRDAAADDSHFRVAYEADGAACRLQSRGSNEEVVLAEIGQVGTQFDTFAHQTIGDSLYNCFKLDDIATRNGFSKLGIENIGGLMTRGVLLDIAALKGVEMLPDTYEITVADLQQALQRQQLTLQPGDAVILHTGWAGSGAKRTIGI
jgi:hypothetical protein